VKLWEGDAPAEPNPKSKIQNPKSLAIGYVLSLEGTDSIINLSYLERAFASGLRAIGPAHYGPGRYSPGTGASGGLTADGRELVKEMRRLGIILDVTHLTDEAFWEALDLYDGPVWASHNNCRALLPHQRLPALLSSRGYSQTDIAGIMHGNWIRKLSESLPA